LHFKIYDCVVVHNNLDIGPDSVDAIPQASISANKEVYNNVRGDNIVELTKAAMDSFNIDVEKLWTNSR
jgi:hypothetical protein